MTVNGTGRRFDTSVKPLALLVRQPRSTPPFFLGSIGNKERMHVSAFRFLWYLVCTVERRKSQKLFAFAQVIEVTKGAKVRLGEGEDENATNHELHSRAPRLKSARSLRWRAGVFRLRIAALGRGVPCSDQPIDLGPCALLRLCEVM